MQKFNPLGLCPKCESRMVNTIYDPSLDVMRRICDGCGYTWNERALDSGPRSENKPLRERIHWNRGDQAR